MKIPSKSRKKWVLWFLIGCIGFFHLPNSKGSEGWGVEIGDEIEYNVKYNAASTSYDFSFSVIIDNIDETGDLIYSLEPDEWLYQFHLEDNKLNSKMNETSSGLIHIDHYDDFLPFGIQCWTVELVFSLERFTTMKEYFNKTCEYFEDFDNSTLYLMLKSFKMLESGEYETEVNDFPYGYEYRIWDENSELYNKRLYDEAGILLEHKYLRSDPEGPEVSNQFGTLPAEEEIHIFQSDSKIQGFNIGLLLSFWSIAGLGICMKSKEK